MSFHKVAENAGPTGGEMLFTDYDADPFANGQVLRMRERRHSSVRFSNAGHDEPIHPRNLVMGTSGDVWLIDWAFTGAYP